MRFDPKVSRAKLPRRSHDPTPAWRRILSTRWFPYLVVLPVGVAHPNSHSVHADYLP